MDSLAERVHPIWHIPFPGQALGSNKLCSPCFHMGPRRHPELLTASVTLLLLLPYRLCDKRFWRPSSAPYSVLGIYDHSPLLPMIGESFVSLAVSIE